MDLELCYNTNVMFKHYVDKYIATYKISLKEALEVKVVQQYAEYLKGFTPHEDTK